MINFSNIIDNISRECMKPALFVRAYLCYTLFYLCKAFIKLDFPNNYNWGELFINYEAGFVRRGLFGEFLFLVQPFCNIRLFILLFFTVVFFLFLKVSYDRISSAFDKITTFIIFICPAYFLFHIKDYEAFIRKDLLIDFLVLASIIVTTNSIAKCRGPLLPTLFFTMCVAISCLLHEIAIIFWPLPACLLALAFCRSGKLLLWLLLMFCIFASAGLLSLYFPGTPETREVICRSWQEFYPDFMCKGGMKYIGAPFDNTLSNTRQYQTNLISVSSFIWALFLSFIPIVWTCAAYRLLPAIYRLFRLRIFILLPLAALSPWIYCTFASDWGRNISMACLEYVFFLWAVLRLTGQEKAPWLSRFLDAVLTSWRTRALTLAAIILYGTSWTLMHWVPVGRPFVNWSGLPDLLLYIMS